MEQSYKHHKFHDVLQTRSITTLDLPLVSSCRRDIVIGRLELDLQTLAELDQVISILYRNRHCFVIQTETFYTFLRSEIRIWRCCLNQLQNWSVLKIWVATPTQSSARLPLFGHPWRTVWCRTQWQQLNPSSQITAEPWCQELIKTQHWTIEKLWHWTHTPSERPCPTSVLTDLSKSNRSGCPVLMSGVLRQPLRLSKQPDRLTSLTWKHIEMAVKWEPFLKPRMLSNMWRSTCNRCNQEFSLVIAKGLHSASTGIDRLNNS